MRVFGNKIYYMLKDGEPDGFKFKGINKSYFETQLKSREERVQFFKWLLDPDQVQLVHLERWKREFGQVVVEEITKMTVTKPRRRVHENGWTSCF